MNFFQSHRGRQDFESFWVFSWRFPLDINLLLTLLPATFSPRFLYDFFWAFARLDFGGDVSCKPLRIVKSFWRKWRWVVERGISLKFSCKLYIWGGGWGGGAVGVFLYWLVACLRAEWRSFGSGPPWASEVKAFSVTKLTNPITGE